MGKPKKTRGCKFNYNKDRRRAWKQSKKLPSIPCDPVKRAWDNSKSTPNNLREMGLSADPNKTFPLPKMKDLLGKTTQSKTKFLAPKSHVVQELEEEANQTYANTMRLSNPNVQFCVYMMNKYKDDYKAMARDPKNYYQETPKQIRRKINTFKNTPTQYSDYLASLKESSTPEHATRRLMRETICPRRRIRTRWSEAAFRNGNLISNSPVPPTCTFLDRKNCALAGLVHARRRLQFGRNPPRERSFLSEHKKKTGCLSTDDSSTTLKEHAPSNKSCVTAADSFPTTTGIEQPETRLWRGLARYTKPNSPRRRLTMDNSRSGLNPDSGYSLRST